MEFKPFIAEPPSSTVIRLPIIIKGWKRYLRYCVPSLMWTDYRILEIKDFGEDEILQLTFKGLVTQAVLWKLGEKGSKVIDSFNEIMSELQSVQRISKYTPSQHSVDLKMQELERVGGTFTGRHPAVQQQMKEMQHQLHNPFGKSTLHLVENFPENPFNGQRCYIHREETVYMYNGVCWVPITKSGIAGMQQLQGNERGYTVASERGLTIKELRQESGLQVHLSSAQLMFKDDEQVQELIKNAARIIADKRISQMEQNEKLADNAELNPALKAAARRKELKHKLK